MSYPRWGSHTYSDGTPVPLRAERCVSHLKGSKAHACREHHTHTAPHRCICGIRWNAAGQVVK